METHQVADLAWDGRRGNVWVELQPLLDRLFRPFEQLLVDAVVKDRSRNILDIGCGTGAVTLAIARRLAQRGDCVGIDISEGMLSHARRLAEAGGVANARFLAGDAQRYGFGQRAFDAVVSRFGVMFFDEPETAFANIGHAVGTGGTLTCLAWRCREENSFMTAAERAAGPLLGWDDPHDSGAPGQFAFADAARVSNALDAAGWRGIEISPIDVSCRLPKAGLLTYARRMGRVGTVLPDLDGPLREAVSAALDGAFAPYLCGDVATFDAACWIIRAQVE